MAESGAIDMTPGKQLAAGEKATRSKLNQGFKPSGRVAPGSIGLRELIASQVRTIVPNVSRNVLINGNFDIWQRGGYVNLYGVPTFLGTSAAYEYGPDRWSLGTPTGASHRAINRQSFDLGQTDVPNFPTYYLRWSQDSSEPTPTLSQPIEDVRTLAGKVATVSWWMKADASLTVLCKLTQYFGTPAGPGSPVTRVIAASSGGSAAVTAGAQWQKFEAQFTIPSLLGYSIGGADSALILQFIMPAGTYKIYYAQVQLEESAVATEYETLSTQHELSRCQRYFEVTATYLNADIATIAIPVDLASIATGDVLTNYTPGYSFKILSWQFAVTKPVTTGGKAATLNLEIDTTNLTGGTIPLTSAACTPIGALVSSSSSITANNVGTSAQSLSVEAAAVAPFIEGQGVLLLKIQKLDTEAVGYFATRKYAAPTITPITGFSGTGATFAALLDVGFYQLTPHSQFATMYLTAEAELKI